MLANLSCHGIERKERREGEESSLESLDNYLELVEGETCRDCEGDRIVCHDCEVIGNLFTVDLRLNFYQSKFLVAEFYPCDFFQRG